MTDEERYETALNTAITIARNEGLGDWIEKIKVVKSEILSSISTDYEPYIFLDREPPSPRLGFIVSHTDRSGISASFKPQNISREISKTVQVCALFGIVNATIADGAPALRVISALVGLCFAAHSSIKASIGYSDACVLHKAWKLARAKGGNYVTLAELLDVKAEIAIEYSAPKCNSEAEIRDAIRNLCGIKAMREEVAGYTLQENIVFFENGNIKN